jgi:hypothetical protein
MHKKLLTFSFALSPFTNIAWGHEGHGLGSSHWHATDTLGFLVVAALLMAAIYFGKK